MNHPTNKPADPVSVLRAALERIADPRNTHFAGDAQVVASAALAATEGAAIQPAGEAVARVTITAGLADRDRMFINGAALGNGIHDLYAAQQDDKAKQAGEAPTRFTYWFGKNYPAGISIHDPAWHAPKIYRAAIAAYEASRTPAAPEGKTEASELPPLPATPPDSLASDYPKEERAAFDKWHMRYGQGFRQWSVYNSVELTAAWAAWYARAALAARPPVAAAPDGWQLVPCEPTPKMVDATFNHRELEGESHNRRNRRVYSAMLAAAPVPTRGSPAPDAEAIRSAALEEAAKICLRAVAKRETVRAMGDAAHYVACRDAIRALSQSSPAVKSAEPTGGAA